MTIEQIRLMMDTFKGQLMHRNRALFMFGLSTGYRAGKEIPTIRLKDVLNENGYYHSSITLQSRHRKGNGMTYTLPLTESVTKELTPWIEQLNKWGYMKPSSFLFCTRSGNPMSYYDIYNVINKALKKSGLYNLFPPYRKGTHMMRKTLAKMCWEDCLERVKDGELLDPLQRLKQILGHQDSMATQSYIEDDARMHETVIRVQDKLKL